MKFLLEILGMTNYCNLNCSYCDWEKNKIEPLTNEEKLNLRRNITNLKKFVDNNYPELQLIEYSGGEPFVYPEVIFELMNQFNNKWIRIITNGLLLKDEYIEKIKQHEKTYIAVSLDGHKLELNDARFYGNKKYFDKVIETIDKLVANKIPTMILCTVTKKNLKEVPAYIQFLEERYAKAIKNALLTLPAHSVCDYGKDRGRAECEESDKFIDYLKNNATKHPIIYKMPMHYANLAYFLKEKERFRNCHLYNWSIAVHFRGREIVRDGNFYSFGCGMRGINDFGIKNINVESDMLKYKQEIETKNLKNIFENPLKAPYQCKKECFVDWEPFDLVLDGIVDLDVAANWFVIFKDKNVQKFVRDYILHKNFYKEDSIEYII